MTDIVVRMAEDGSFSVNGDAGRIEEYCAKRLKIGLNSVFASTSVSYYTLSFEPYNLSRKIITENIYKNSSTTAGIYYSLGYIFCPIYDYMAISPEVSVQIDAYELDDDGNVKTIIKSGIFKLEFAESLTGEGVILDTVRQDVKFKENVEKAVGEALKSAALNGANIVNSSVTSNKIDENAIKNEHLSSGCVTQDKIAVGCIGTNLLSDESVSAEKIKNGSIGADEIADGSITSSKIAEKNITSACIADKTIIATKISDNAVSEPKIRPRAVTTEKIALRAVTPNRLDRKYLTEHQSLKGYATEEWVEGKNFITDISMKADKTEIPEKLSELENDTAVSFVKQILTDEEKDTALQNIGAVKAVTGKVLSSNDFTNEEKEKLENALTEHQDITMKADKGELSEVAFTGLFESLRNVPTFSPVAITGSYNSLEDLPTLSSVAITGSYNSLVDLPTLSSVAITGSYNSLVDLPTLSPVAITGSYNNLKNVPDFSSVAFSGSYNDLKDKPEHECLFTDALKQNYDIAFNHSQENHAPENAEENMINKAYLNGEEVEIKDKNLNLQVMDYEERHWVFAEV